MTTLRHSTGPLPLALIAVSALSVASCAHKPKPSYPTQAPAQPSQAPVERPVQRAPVQPPVSQAPLPGSERDFVINVGDRVYFDFDKYSIRDDAAPILEAQAAWLKRFPAVQVRIEGNCDERGTREYNLALGARRANAVREYLVAHGVEAARVTTVSYGKEKPFDTGSGDTADQHNRNGHTALVSGARMP